MARGHTYAVLRSKSEYWVSVYMPWKQKCKDWSDLTLFCPSYNNRNEARKEAGKQLLPVSQLRPSMTMLDQTHPQGDEIASQPVAIDRQVLIFS